MVYVHVPFCKSKCIYCGFFSCPVAPGASFVDEICAEAVARRAEIAASSSVDTLYIGGGTPSVLPLSCLGRIADACGGRSYREWTVEVNPDDVTPSYARGLRAEGVNRVSMGVQSLDDSMLRWMRRRHSASGARSAFRALRAAGFDNISVDIIYGINGMNPEMLMATVEEIVSWHPEHISAYALSVDNGSVLAGLCQEGKYREVDGDDHYALVCSALAAAGYEHYEISNWALPGRRAVHNSAYWIRQPYVGLGPGAHSLGTVAGGTGIHSSVTFPKLSQDLSQSHMGPSPECDYRSWNSDELSGWASKGESLTDREIWEEEIMLGLRTTDGIPASLLTDYPPEDSNAPGEYATDSQNIISKLVPSAVPGNLRIPEDRWFTADGLISDLLCALC